MTDASVSRGTKRRGDDYDRFVDWDKRLGREEPFFRTLFAERDVSRVIDMGCGTGRHAALFASWGLSVTGVDPNPAMLEQARTHAGTVGQDVAFLQGGLGDLTSLGLADADAVVCTGNALPHVAGVSGLAAALTDFASALRPGGTLVLHLLNHERLLAKRARALPPVIRDDDEGTWVFQRVLDFLENAVRFDFVTLHRPLAQDGEQEWEIASSTSSLHTPMPPDVLVAALEHAGFSDIALFGDHTRRPFDTATDESVIVVATSGR